MACEEGEKDRRGERVDRRGGWVDRRGRWVNNGGMGGWMQNQTDA